MYKRLQHYFAMVVHGIAEKWLLQFVIQRENCKQLFLIENEEHDR